MLGVQRHLLDEAQVVPLGEAEPKQVNGFVLVDAAHEHGVDLDRRQAGVACRRESIQYVREPVTAGDLEERFGVDRVQRDVDPVQPGRGEPRGAPGETDSVGGHGQSRPRLECGDPPDEVLQARPQQRFAPG